MSWTRTGLLTALLLGSAGLARAEGSGHGASAHGASAPAAPAHEAAGHSAGGSKPPKATPKRMTLPVSPVSLIEGSKSAWSVSDTEAGCYLMSPARRNSSRVALGRHPEHGLGLFAVNIALSVPGPDQLERIAIQTGEGELGKDGRMIGAALLFMPLSQAELDQALRTLSSTGTLWLVVRGAWLSHAGIDLATAIDEFHKQCGRKPSASGAVASAAGSTPAVPVATVGSKSASAP